MNEEQRPGPRWVIRRRVWAGELLWVAWERVDRGPFPPLWVDRAVANRWAPVMGYVESQVREAWLSAEAPAEPPASAR